VKAWILLLVWCFAGGEVWGAECMTSGKKGVAGKTSVSNYVSVGAGWWYNWQHWNLSDFNNQVEMVPMVRFCKDSKYCVFYDRGLNKPRQSSAELVRQVVEKRGEGGYWLIGNEPEVPNQDEVYDPVVAARMYREMVDFIKISDPKAKFIVGGWAGPEESKKNWPLLLQRKWSEYGEGGGNLCESIAGWHFHHYAWPVEYQTEVGLAGWKKETSDFADYLLNLCPGKEVWLTEFGSLSADRNNEASVEALTNGMKWMVNFLESNERIDRYGWFYAIDGPVYEKRLPGLFTVNGQMTLLGQTFEGLGNEKCGRSPTVTVKPINTISPTITVTVTKTPTRVATKTPTPNIGLCINKNQGDANCDGVVNIMDFGIWKSEFIVKQGKEADFNRDGEVSIVDFALWKKGFLSK